MPRLHARPGAIAGGCLAAVLAAAGLAAPALHAQPAPVQVPTAQVQARDVPDTMDGIGHVQALNTVTVRAQVDGVLLGIEFREGAPVRRGDVLARIDPRLYQAALDQALAHKAQQEADLANARLNLQRYQGVGDFASRQQVATQQATVAQLEAQVRAADGAIAYARTQLDYATITAPIDGIAGIQLVDAGNLVRAADATGIVVINQVQPISLLFTLPGEALGEVRRALADGPPRVTVLERGGARVLGEGTLDLVDNQIDPATGQIRLKATLPNVHSALWPGQFVTARLLLRVDREVPTVPSTAIQRGPSGAWLYVVGADGTVNPQPVSVRRFSGGLAVLESGPAPGTTVVASGQFRLSPGTRIALAPAPAPAATAARR